MGAQCFHWEEKCSTKSLTPVTELLNWSCLVSNAACSSLCIGLDACGSSQIPLSASSLAAATDCMTREKARLRRNHREEVGINIIKLEFSYYVAKWEDSATISPTVFHRYHLVVYVHKFGGSKFMEHYTVYFGWSYLYLQCITKKTTVMMTFQKVIVLLISCIFCLKTAQGASHKHESHPFYSPSAHRTVQLSQASPQANLE